MKIKQLAIEDYDAIVKLWSEAGLPFKPKGRDSKVAIQSQMALNPSFFLGAFENGDLIGVSMLSSDGRKGWINRLAVAPEFRRCGVAARLIMESEKNLRDAGLEIFCALIDDDNVASKSLFKKSGYVEHHDIAYFSKRSNDEV